MVRRLRSAYTLMEIVLVLGVLVIVAALSMPVIDTMQAGPRLTAATDMVRARLSEVQRRAIEERRAYRFAIKDNSSSFKIAPDTTQFWPDSTNQDDGSSSSTQTSWVLEDKLPSKVVFSSSGSNTVGGAEGSDWKTVVTFQADGTSIDDADVTMATQGTGPATLHLSGATGVVTTAALASILNQY
jgi:Tfp pilus assembly protein FimT